MTQGGHAAAFNYRGSDLFGQQATRIYVDFDQNECTNGVLVGRSYELWMLEDMSIIAVACVSMSCNDGTYITEYREVKGDPRECDMCLDLVDLTDQLDDLCWAVYEHKIPVFEL